MKQELKDNLTNFAKNRGDIDLMIIFGSRAKGRKRPNRDLDLASLAVIPVERKLSPPMCGANYIIFTSLLQEILFNGKKIYLQQDHLMGVLYVRLMDWRTDFMPAWEDMLEQRKKRFLTKRKLATTSK